jgi:hypothetical protein
MMSVNLGIRVVVLLFIGLVLFSCDSYLDEVPDNRVALNDLDKAAQVLTNAYSVASPAFTDWMTDDVQFTRGTSLRASHQQMYAWEDVNTGPNEQDTPDFYWFETYNAIAHANEVLAVLAELPATTDEERARKRAIEGEARLTRAYGHFMLVNLFAEHFDLQESSNPGVPYITTPETEFLVQYERNSVKKVYENVEEDLLTGLDLIDDSFFLNSGKYHFNRNAALAFASRFYLYRRDYIRCIDYASQLLGSDPGSFVRDMTSEEFRVAKSSITAYPQLYSSPDLPSNLLLMRKISLVQRPDFAYGPTRNFYGDLFASPFAGATDEREDPALVKGENALQPVRYESLFQRSSLNSNVGLPYHIAVIFRGEEVLLNRAEAYILTNQLDAALADLQVLTDRRYSGTNTNLSLEFLRALFGAEEDPSFTDQLVLLNYLFLERRKEFITQGMRWFDIKRYGFEVRHDLSDGTSFIVLEENDLRKVLQIPISAQEVGGLEPNPR